MATIKNFERKGGFKIDGYKDIIDEDKNININDKSKSILELLSKYSFSN